MLLNKEIFSENWRRFIYIYLYCWGKRLTWEWTQKLPWSLNL